MKQLLVIFLLFVFVSPPMMAAGDESADMSENSQLDEELAAVTKYLDDLTNLLGKTRSGNVKGITKQFRRIDKYFESAAAQRAHKLIINGFHCPEKSERSPRMEKKVERALRSLDRYRRAAAKMLKHLERNFTSCDHLGAEDDTDAIADLLDCAEREYTKLYETLGVADEDVPDWSHYHRE